VRALDFGFSFNELSFASMVDGDGDAEAKAHGMRSSSGFLLHRAIDMAPLFNAQQALV
jgi:hypothetical protein